MEKIDIHIALIQSKVQDLLKKHTDMQKLVSKQQETITALKQKEEEQQNKIRALEEQQYILKSAAGKLNDADKKAFEQTIGKYIREIDKCIALLSE